MITLELTDTIERPIEEVWEFTHDLSKSSLWQTTLIESTQLDDGPFGVGTRISEARRFLGLRIETVWECTALEAPRLSSIRSLSGPVQWGGSYILEPVAEGTRFTLRIEGEMSPFFRVTEPVLRRMTRREMEASMGHLKDILESGLASLEPAEAAAATG